MAEATDERAQQDRQVGARMTGAVIVVSIFLFLGKVAGYVKEAIMADYWGLSGGLDAFKVVYNSVIILVYTKAEKLLRPTYLPIFVQHRDHDREDEAWRFFSTATNLSFLVLLAITALCTGFAPEIIRLGWPRMAASDVALAVSLLRISGAPWSLVLSVMLEMTLHSYKRFTAPALAGPRAPDPAGHIYGLVAAGAWPRLHPRRPRRLCARPPSACSSVRLCGCWSSFRPWGASCATIGLPSTCTSRT